LDESEGSEFFTRLGRLSLRDDAARIAAMVAKVGYVWSDKDGEASSLEEAKKNYLAKLTLEYLESPGPGSKPGAVKSMPVSQAEIRALADPRYEAYIKDMVERRKLANMARVRFDVSKLYVEMQRSANAARRSEANLAGMHT